VTKKVRERKKSWRRWILWNTCGDCVYMEEGITHWIFNENPSTIAWSKVNLNFNNFINYWFFQSILKLNIVDVFQLPCPSTIINVCAFPHTSLLYILGSFSKISDFLSVILNQNNIFKLSITLILYKVKVIIVYFYAS